MSRSKEIIARRWELIRKYKVSQGCYKCGYNAHAMALCFTHIDPLTKHEELTFAGTKGAAQGGVARFVRSLSIRDKVKNRQYIRRMFAEFRKCNIQCTNCHNIETHENGDHNGRSSKNKTRFSKLTPPPTVGTLETFL